MSPFELSTLKSLAISFCFLVLFSTAAFSKVQSLNTPEWFVKQFEKSIIAKIPQGATFAYWLIALLETALAVAFLMSMVGVPILPYALVGAMFLFGILCFGLRITFDFQGSANMFIYFAAALISLMSLGG